MAGAEPLLRPLEPIPRPGRGMHVLGFVTPKLEKLPVTSPAKELKKEETQPPSNGEGGSQVRGPSGWKNGRPIYVHGNYKQYYGYRPGYGAEAEDLDPRLKALVEKLGPDMFRGQEVLDIGCHKGLVTLAAFRRFGARRAVGIDIDASLIEAAQANCSKEEQGGVEFRAEDILSSPLRRPPSMAPERFDVVLCLSVTKWVHFAAGDTGVRNLFKRCWKRLRPGGLLVLEPQDWSSYLKKRHISREVRETVRAIELRPEGFAELLEADLGFRRLGAIHPPDAESAPRLFRRAIHLFVRPQVADAEEEAEAPAYPWAKLRRRKRSKGEQAHGGTEPAAAEEGAGEEGSPKKGRARGARAVGGEEEEERGDEEEEDKAEEVREKAKKRRRRGSEELGA